MQKMNRRQFLRVISAAGLSACALPTYTRAQEGMAKPIWDWGQLPSRVFKDRVESPSIVGTSQALSAINVEWLVREAVEKGGGLNKIIQPGDTVLIKPNLFTNVRSGTGLTTDVRVAEAVAKLALDCGAKRLVLAEGSSTNIGQKKYSSDVTERCFDVSGYADLAKRIGATLIDLNDAGEKPGGRELVKNVGLEHGLKKKSYWISKHLFDVDCVISVPVLKNHRYAGVTLSLKNYVGIAPADVYQAPGAGVPAGKFGLDHSTLGLAQHIVDLVMIRPPDYAVIDALVGLGTWTRDQVSAGPKGPMRAILAGRDPVAVDTVACITMGYEPKTIGHLVFASAVGLGVSGMNRIEVRGAGIESLQQEFPIPVSGSWYRPGRYGQRPES
jgi:uncharacterized protein (DUF362 family)